MCNSSLQASPDRPSSQEVAASALPVPWQTMRLAVIAVLQPELQLDACISPMSPSSCSAQAHSLSLHVRSAHYLSVCGQVIDAEQILHIEWIVAIEPSRVQDSLSTSRYHSLIQQAQKVQHLVKDITCSTTLPIWQYCPEQQ